MSLSYRLRPFDVARNDMRQTAVISCAKCGEQGKLPVVNRGNNPEWIEKQFIRMRWECDVHNAKRNLCPRCIKNREIRLEKEQALDKLAQLGQEIERGARQPEYPGIVPVKKKEEQKEMSIKDLSPEKKTALRNELGGTFDEAAGRYIDGNSDHSISEKLGIPRKTVVEFREAFYGELKDDPEITAFRMQLEDAKRVVNNMQTTLQKMEEKLATISKRVGL